MKKYDYSKLFTIFSIIFFSVGLLKSELVISKLGLLEGLSPFLIIAIMFNVLAIINFDNKNKNHSLILINIFIIITIIWLIPYWLEGTPRFSTTYRNWGFVEYILSNGYIEPDKWVLWYHNWPSFFVWAVMLAKTLGTNGLYNISIFFPYAVQIILALSIIVLLKMIMHDSMLPYYACIIFTFGNWVGQNYFSPQALAYASLLISFIVFFKKIEKQKELEFTIILIVNLFLLVTTHVLTALFFIMIVFVVFLFNKQIYSTLLIGLIVFVAWLVFGANFYFESKLEFFLNHCFNINQVISSNVENRMQGDYYHRVVVIIRIIFSLIVGCVSLIGLLLEKNNIKKYLHLLIILFVAFFMAPLFNYGGEWFIRMYLFALVSMSAFASLWLKYKKFKNVLVVIIICFVPLHFICHYGNEKIDYFSHAFVESSDFFYKHMKKNSKVIGGKPILGYTKNVDKYKKIDWIKIYSINNLKKELNKKKYNATYLIISSRQKKYYKTMYGKDVIGKFEKNIKKSNVNNIYDNCYLKMFNDDN